jgi:hypothetical protein
VTTGINRIVGLEDFSLFVDKVADALCVARLGIIASAIGEAERAHGVAQQGERKAELLREGSIFRYRVKTHAQYFYILGAKIGYLIAEPATLGSSTRSVGFGIKP